MIIIIREAIRGGEETCVKRMRHAASDSTTQPDACERRVSVHVRLSRGLSKSIWRVDSAKPKDSLEEAKEQPTLRRRGNV